MEIKLNKEIRNYSEAIFFGLNLRQTVCSILAVGVSISTYFLFRNSLNLEVVSWLCIMTAAPFGAFGFIQYNGMALERFLLVWLKSELLTAKTLLFRPVNLYLESAKPYLQNMKKRRNHLFAKFIEKRTKT